MKNLTVQLNETMEKFIVAWNNFEVCRNEYNTWGNTLVAAQAQLKNATDYYNSKKAEFLDFIDLFTGLYEYYKKEIYSASDDYKARADDYIDDQTFNNTTDFTKRSADQYNDLSGSVQSETYNEAAQSSTLSQLKSNKVEESKEESQEEVMKRAEILREKIKNLTKFRA